MFQVAFLNRSITRKHILYTDKPNRVYSTLSVPLYETNNKLLTLIRIKRKWIITTNQEKRNTEQMADERRPADENERNSSMLYK